MSIEQFQQHVDESQEQLRRYLAMLDTGRQQVVSVHQDLVSQSATLGEAAQQLVQQFETTSELAEASDFEHPPEELIQSLAGLSETLEECGDRLDNESNQFTTAVESASESINASVEALEEALGRLQACQAESNRQLSEVGNRLEQLTDTATEHLKQVEQTVEGAEAAFNEEADTAISAVIDLAKAGEQEHPSRLNELFDALDAVSETQLRDSLIQTIEGFGDELLGLVEDFDGEVEGLGAQLEERLQEVLGNLKDHLESEAESQINDALRQLLQDVVTAFATEIVEAVAVTQVGVATTSSLSAMLPSLVAAKKALEVINHGLSIFAD